MSHKRERDRNNILTAGREPAIFHYVQTASGKTEFHPNGSLVLRSVEQADGGHYRCEVQNGVGDLSKTVLLDVQGRILPPSLPPSVS